MKDFYSDIENLMQNIMQDMEKVADFFKQKLINWLNS